jgi:hypothetical protein
MPWQRRPARWRRRFALRSSIRLLSYIANERAEELGSRRRVGSADLHSASEGSVPSSRQVAFCSSRGPSEAPTGRVREVRGLGRPETLG